MRFIHELVHQKIDLWQVESENLYTQIRHRWPNTCNVLLAGTSTAVLGDSSCPFELYGGLVLSQRSNFSRQFAS